MIRRAKLQEIPDILRITKACAADMANCGIYQWNEHYPSREISEKDLERDELYVLAKPYGIIGLIVISEFMDPEYRREQHRRRGRSAARRHGREPRRPAPRARTVRALRDRANPLQPDDRHPRGEVEAGP
jgi:hypothetical protein